MFGSEPDFDLRDYASGAVPADSIEGTSGWAYADYQAYGVDQSWESGFDAAYSFREGFALVKNEGVFRFLNKDGKSASDERFEDAFSFNEGVAPVMKNGKLKENIPNYPVNIYTDACSNGAAAGCFMVGVQYDEGEGVAKDAVKAVEYYAKACELGLTESCELSK